MKLNESKEKFELSKIYICIEYLLRNILYVKPLLYHETSYKM